MNIVGARVDRIDAVEKVSGRARYAADIRPDGCLVALGLRSIWDRARILSFDTKNALALSGIKAVFTHEDAEALGWRSSPEVDALSAEGLGRAALADEASKLPAYRPLTSPDIFFAGQWIAVVVAETLEQARAALAAIKVDVESGTPEQYAPVLPGAFFAADMQHVHQCANEAGPEAFRMTGEYLTPMQLHQPMEPSAATAVWEGGDLTLYDSTQGVRATRSYVARSLGMPEDRVRVVSPYVGGGFGAKNQVWPHQALAAHLARALTRPVRLQLTRADMAVASGYRSETVQKIDLAADAGGRLTLLRHESTIPTSLRGGFFEPCGLNSLLLYKASRVEIAHRVERRAVATPTPFRAPGETPGSFALETALDELAHEMRVDPLDLRIRNFAEKDFYHQRAWSSNELLECYRRGAERFGWPNRYIEPGSMLRDGLRVGYGMATTAYPAPALPASVRIALKRGAGILVETSATDIGTGMRTILLQTVAQELGVDPEHIRVALGDSSLPDAPTAGRSKSTASVLPAAMDACRKLLAELDRLVPNPATGANVTGPIERFDRSECDELATVGQSSGAPKDMPFSAYSFGAHFVEVELDEPIGRLRVRRVVSAFDCGRIVNPKLAESQICGGIIFGVGMALMENGVRHPKSLRVVTDNLADYAVPVHADIPAIDVIFVEKPDVSFNEMGARGLGEIGLPGVAAAIGNAVFNATGQRHRSLPIGPASIKAGGLDRVATSYEARSSPEL